MPKANVQSSGMNSTVNTAGKGSAHNRSASGVSKVGCKEGSRISARG